MSCRSVRTPPESAALSHAPLLPEQSCIIIFQNEKRFKRRVTAWPFTKSNAARPFGAACGKGADKNGDIDA